MRNTISLCMIVKDEEKVLERCIESARNLVDEIIVVDTGSSDRTLEIAQKYTDKIYHFEWIQDFSAARNYSIRQATSDYILVLDADEYLDGSANLKEDISSEKDFYIMKIQNHNSDERIFTHSAIRLFANDPRFFYKNRLHEHLNVTDPELENQLSRGDARTLIQHTGYFEEVMLEKDKSNRNYSLMKTEVEENPTGYNLYNMGKVLMNMEKYEDAIEYFQKAFPLAHGRMFQPELLSRLGFCLLMLSEYEQGIKVMNDAVQLYPEDVDIRSMQARLYMEGGYVQDAEKALLQCLEIGDQGVSVTEGSGSYMARYLLSKLYEQQGLIAQSYEQIIQVLQEKPMFTGGLQQYLNIMGKANIPSDEVYSSINSLYQVSDVSHLQKLLDVLYHTRSSLLLEYLQKYKVNLQPNEQAVAYQYAGKYTDAEERWSKQDSLDNENIKDVLLLAVLLNSEQLLDMVLPLLNVNHKEVKLLKKLVNGERQIVGAISTFLGNVLLVVAEHTIKLQEFDCFERIISVLLLGSVEMKYSVGRLLHQYGFDELAVELLMKEYNQNLTNKNIHRLLGDICVKQNYIQDAVLFYTRLVEISNDYRAYESLYKALIKAEETTTAKDLQKMIMNRFPEAQWIRQAV
ncbi:glycosyltransferase [Paenibacillus sp. JX-17]|uniref:Glycosyltransferase n=1 Tax=Paenibacillus lacisoli TaxID=3064525 RepID=A0ABT9CG38_9BACL|nr:glycosyltransferase [Paenibacillus sp. JX-17]MDO7906568.1 glycosyltransferase [Paenibacillus sp. JX-17]